MTRRSQIGHANICTVARVNFDRVSNDRGWTSLTTDRASSLRDRDNLGPGASVAGFIRYISIREVRGSHDTATNARISFPVGRPLVNCGFRIRILPDVACPCDKLPRESGLRALLCAHLSSIPLERRLAGRGVRRWGRTLG
jgi:hypothetical protein